VTDSDDIEFYKLSIHNSHGHFWSCDNIEQSPMPKLAIEKSIEKFPHHVLSGNLFDLDHGIEEHQFVGFVSSHAKSNVMTSFHLHSLITFYTGSDKHCHYMNTYTRISHPFQHARLSHAAATVDTVWKITLFQCC
jgi:hypothetical protein